ncbi:MAG: hypothetical protein K8R92_10370 [Planctomycetes bacterium]|nr:hypothetical protein [Planctomycetota bacterium]
MEPTNASNPGDAPARPSYWGWSFRMHEFVELPLRTRLLVHWRANLSMLRSPKILVISSLISVVPTFAMVLLMWRANLWRIYGIFFGSLPPTPFLVILGFSVTGWILLQHLVFIYVLNRFYAPFVRRELTAMGMPMCPACGQRLADRTVARCSECGTRLSADDS